MQKEVRARAIVRGAAKGELIVIDNPISLLGELNAYEGTVLTPSGKIVVKGKILFIPSVRGSTVGSYVLYAAKEEGTAPSGIIVMRPDPIIITGAILADIPLFHPIETLDIEEIKAYRYAVLDPSEEKILFKHPG